MIVALVLVLLAHLIGESWHIEDALLYGGACLGLVLGIGLFLWGRGERVPGPDHPASDEIRRPHAVPPRDTR